MDECQIELTFPRMGTGKGGIASAATRKRPPRHRSGEPFLKGPVPLGWLARAAGLPGKALHLAVLLWYRAGLERSDTVKLTNSAAALFGIRRDAKRRALLALEQAGLVEVTRSERASPVVSILAAPPAGPAARQPSHRSDHDDERGD